MPAAESLGFAAMVPQFNSHTGPFMRPSPLFNRLERQQTLDLQIVHCMHHFGHLKPHSGARNETKARETVLARFGDPRRIARKLWFEAMKEKIMSQRLMLASSAVTTALCLAMGFFLWRISAQSAEASRALIEETREMNRALIEKLGAVAAPGAPPQPSDMVHLTIRLVQNAPNGPAAAGYAVDVRRSGPLGSPEVDSSQIQDKSGTDGTIDCGLVKFGSYIAEIATPGKLATEVNFYIRAGRAEQVETVVCPEPPEDGPVSLAYEVPSDLRAQDLRLDITIQPLGRELQGVYWMSRSLPENGILSPDGTLYEYYGYEGDPNRTKYLTYKLSGSARKMVQVPFPFVVRLNRVVIATPPGRSAVAGEFVVLPVKIPNEIMEIGRSETTDGDQVQLRLDEVWELVRKALVPNDAEQSPPVDEGASQATPDGDTPEATPNNDN
jgi:hypothetical protein